MNWNEFFHMGGYAFYVWTSWSLTAFALCWLFVQAKIGNTKIRAEIIRQMRREELASGSDSG